MICPKCHSQCRILNSRHSSKHQDGGKIPMRFKKLDEQFTFRHHKCRSSACGHKFQSIELTADVITRLEARIRERVIAELKQKIEEMADDS